MLTINLSALEAAALYNILKHRIKEFNETSPQYRLVNALRNKLLTLPDGMPQVISTITRPPLNLENNVDISTELSMKDIADLVKDYNINCTPANLHDTLQGYFTEVSKLHGEGECLHGFNDVANNINNNQSKCTFWFLTSSLSILGGMGILAGGGLSAWKFIQFTMNTQGILMNAGIVGALTLGTLGLLLGVGGFIAYNKSHKAVINLENEKTTMIGNELGIQKAVRMRQNMERKRSEELIEKSKEFTPLLTATENLDFTDNGTHNRKSQNLPSNIGLD